MIGGEPKHGLKTGLRFEETSFIMFYIHTQKQAANRTEREDINRNEHLANLFFLCSSSTWVSLTD